jgi:non-heme chloroperoxidase
MKAPVDLPSKTRRTVTFAAADGTRLAYHLAGPATPTVVLVHGWMTSGRVWHRLLDGLPGRGALVVDLRGTGVSAPGSTPLSLDLLVDDLSAVVDHAALERFHLVGHSMGGQLCQLLAARHPTRVRSLALVNPVPLAGLPLPPEMTAAFRAAGGKRQVFDGILAAACKELGDDDRAALLDEALGTAPETIAQMFDAWNRGMTAPSFPAITAPTMVLATDDPFLPADLLASAVVAHIPGARLEKLSGPGHYPQLERPGPTARHLHELWDRS